MTPTKYAILVGAIRYRAQTNESWDAPRTFVAPGLLH